MGIVVGKWKNISLINSCSMKISDNLRIIGYFTTSNAFQHSIIILHSQKRPVLTSALICCKSDHWNEKSSKAVGRTDGTAIQNPGILFEGVILSTSPGKLERNKSHCPALGPFR